MPTGLPTYLSLGAFYASDDRRDASHEIDVGLWWRGDATTAPSSAPPTSSTPASCT